MTNGDRAGFLVCISAATALNIWVSMLVMANTDTKIAQSEVRITKHVDTVTDFIVNESWVRHDMSLDALTEDVEEFTMPPTGGEIDCLLMDVPKPNDMNASGRIQCKFASGFPLVM